MEHLEYFTDAKNAQRFWEVHRDDVHYIPETGEFVKFKDGW
jgi:hypothetical protein